METLFASEFNSSFQKIHLLLTSQGKGKIMRNIKIIFKVIISLTLSFDRVLRLCFYDRGVHGLGVP